MSLRQTSHITESDLDEDLNSFFKAGLVFSLSDIGIGFLIHILGNDLLWNLSGIFLIMTVICVIGWLI